MAEGPAPSTPGSPRICSSSTAFPDHQADQLPADDVPRFPPGAGEQRRLAGASVWWFDPRPMMGRRRNWSSSTPFPEAGESSTRLPPGNAPGCGPGTGCSLSGPECAVLTAFEDDPVGACPLPFGRPGVLKLDSAAEEAFNPRELAQLRAVVAKLATAIQGGLALARVKRSEAALREKTEELDRYFTSSLDLFVHRRHRGASSASTPNGPGFSATRQEAWRAGSFSISSIPTTSTPPSPPSAAWPPRKASSISSIAIATPTATTSGWVAGAAGGPTHLCRGAGHQ